MVLSLACLNCLVCQAFPGVVEVEEGLPMAATAVEVEAVVPSLHTVATVVEAVVGVQGPVAVAVEDPHTVETAVEGEAVVPSLPMVATVEEVEAGVQSLLTTSLLMVVTVVAEVESASRT